MSRGSCAPSLALAARSLPSTSGFERAGESSLFVLVILNCFVWLGVLALHAPASSVRRDAHGMAKTDRFLPDARQEHQDLGVGHLELPLCIPRSFAHREPQLPASQENRSAETQPRQTY